MENYPRLFIKASLIYAIIGAVLGMAMAFDPALAGKIRFVHIHLNLLGFMTMFIAGVAFHVLPRFNARPVPWPEGVKYQFYLHNIGLVGMVTLHTAGAMWGEGVSHWLFILFAVSAGVGIFFMFYNLYFVLSPAKTADDPPSEITGDMKVGAVLDQFPQAMPVFMQSGFTSLANPAARKTLAKIISIEKACEKHDVDCAEFLNKLNAVLSGKPPTSASPPTKQESQKNDNLPSGKEIHRGEMCQADTLVGSLIKVYPATKPVFEKHYGEGCFSCPGQAFEQVQETAHMHNVDPDLILKEINTVLRDENRK
jgi:uncharacterized protein DUF1858